MKNLKKNNILNECRLSCRKVSYAIKKSKAIFVLVNLKKKRKHLQHNNDWRTSIEQYCKARNDYIKSNNQTTKEVLIRI